MIAILTLAMMSLGLSTQDHPPRCERVGDTFYLSGRISPELSRCVEASLGAGVSEIVVDSQGGDAAEALRIAERLDGMRFTLTVRGQCSSGCANLFLPLAARVVVDPGSYVVLHGTLDPQQIQRELIGSRARFIAQALRDNPALNRALVEKNYDEATAMNVGLMRRMSAFADRHRIPRGWLFYREPGDQGLGVYVSGHIQRYNPALVLVEETLMRSCLPHVQIEPYQAELEASLTDNRERFESFQRAGGVRSADLVCTSGPR